MSINRYHITTTQFGYPQPENNFGYIDENYDTSCACLTCNIGHKQKDEFRFKNDPKIKNKHQFLGLNWVFDQIFVRQEVKDVFEEERITGIKFSKPVIHKTGEPIDRLYQLRVDNLISNGLLKKNLNIEICEMPKEESVLKFLKANNSQLIEGPFCGQTKYNFLQGDNHLIFKADAFEDITDFARLEYYFGSGSSANKPIIISEKVKQIIDRENWKGVFLEQIRLV
ncbi:hypothetical protein [Empedobacter tilapiae]